MATLSVVITTISLCILGIHSKRDLSLCPCTDLSLCTAVNKTYEKELYAFIGGGNSPPNVTSIYNWTYVTSLAIKYSWVNEPGVPQIMCDAHQNNARVIYRIPNKFPFTFDTNKITEWIEELFNTTESLFYDGLSFDYEGHMLWSSTQSLQYNLVVNMTTQYYHQNLPGSTVSVCVPWEAYYVNGRQYDYATLAQSSDFLYIMGYDMQPQIFDAQCIAKANAPYQAVERGVMSYLNLGIKASQLVLGVPWYGRQYQCIMSEVMFLNQTWCPIVPKENNGVNCSQSAGAIVTFGAVESLVFEQNKNVTPIQFDNVMWSPYVNMHGSGESAMHQYWWDNVRSLTLKYNYSKRTGLKGVGPFQINDLIQDKSQGEMQRAQAMWTAFDTFFL